MLGVAFTEDLQRMHGDVLNLGKRSRDNGCISSFTGDIGADPFLTLEEVTFFGIIE
jgi:hypothetical protein